MRLSKSRLSFLWTLPFGPVPEITPDELQAWLSSGRDLTLLDSRTELEYRQGTLPEALHAPVTGLPRSIDQHSLTGDKPVVVLCLSGHRSRPGTRLLRARGVEAYSLRGGLLNWRRAGYDIRLLG